ncbi:hypothetical protein AB0H71_13835 [Nocardia sp. NPDC050697]|uniref:hypothetical protein n=1 Tax=Nocardia sp. NPDC050697 TaxID=3155158 RepID=UPI003411D877
MSNVRSLDNPNHMFISRHELHLLREKLQAVPTLAADLHVTITKQARIGKVGQSRKPRRPSEQPLPYNADAADAADALHNELAGWVRLVCEHRNMDFQPVGWPAQKPLPHDYSASTRDLARWLERYIVSLAMTPGAEMAWPLICDVVDRAERIVCPPSRPNQIDQVKLERARAQFLNASGIAMLAKELDEKYRHLTQRRVYVLLRAGKIKPVPGPWRQDWPILFRLGDVLDAHLDMPIRERHAKAS